MGRPTVQVVLRGFSLTSNEGNFAPCAVYLVRGSDADGTPRTLLYDFGHVGRRLKLQAALGRRGLIPSDVDYAVLSHAHWDHAQNIDLFTNAVAVVGAAELEYLRAPHPRDHATPAWSAAMLDSLRVRAVRDGDELLPGVRVLGLPGHTAGSIGLRVETDAGTAVISGDAVASAADALAGICPNVFWDPDAADASVGTVLATADIVYPGHDRPFRLHESDGAGGRVEYLTGIRELNLFVRDTSTTPVSVAARQRSARSLLARAADLFTGRAGGPPPHTPS